MTLWLLPILALVASMCIGMLVLQDARQLRSDLKARRLRRERMKRRGR